MGLVVNSYSTTQHKYKTSFSIIAENSEHSWILQKTSYITFQRLKSSPLMKIAVILFHLTVFDSWKVSGKTWQITLNKAQSFYFLLDFIPREFFVPNERDSSRRNRSIKNLETIVDIVKKILIPPCSLMFWLIHILLTLPHTSVLWKILFMCHSLDSIVWQERLDQDQLPKIKPMILPKEVRKLT